jgi:hypothetical protein
MLSLKDIKLAEKRALQQVQVVSELKELAKDIQRCEKTIRNLKGDLESINSRHPQPRTTREDITYLTELLDCAKRKLAWEKQMASLQKRTPATLETMTRLMNDPQSVPAENTRSEMLRALQEIQGAMERLNEVKVS